MSERPSRRILAGPFDGHLTHQDVRDIFSPYGVVLRGGYYHHTQNVPFTYGYVEMDNETSVRDAIVALIAGSFSKHGRRIQITHCEAAGRLPMGLGEWQQALQFGYYEGCFGLHEKDNASESSSNVKASDRTDAKTEESSKCVKPEKYPNDNKGDSASKVKGSTVDIKLDHVTDVMDTSKLFKLPDRNMFEAGKKAAAAKSLSILRASKGKDGAAPNKERHASKPN